MASEKFYGLVIDTAIDAKQVPTPAISNRSAESQSSGPEYPSPLAAAYRRASTGSISLEQSKSLKAALELRMPSAAEDEDGRSHSHGPKPQSVLTAAVSGIINWLLMFGLCCAYGMILFSDDWHLQHRPLGVKMSLATAAFVGLALSAASGIPVAIGGPDLNPVVFLAGFVDVIGRQIAEDLGLQYPGQGFRRLKEGCKGDDIRCLAAAKVSEFCSGVHLEAYPLECAEYHGQLRPTVIFCITVSSAILGIIFFCLGRFKLSRFVGCVPTSVMEAFLSCVGYKVFMYGLKFCKFDPKQFCPAALLGVLMYFIKALHIGNPALSIPLLIAVPLGVFYAIVYGLGSSLEEARSEKYMFPLMEDVGFWEVWSMWGDLDKINLSAWVKTLPDLAVMIIVCSLDCLLKLSGTENKLPVKVDKDREMQLFGLSNLLTVVTGSPVGYMQLKFNVINYGVMGNASDRRGGIFYSLLCAVSFFGTIRLFNFQPRFFLSMLLFFAGTGFVAENLWGSSKFLTQREWMQVFTILGVFIFSGQLLYAVLIGGLITCADFIYAYAKIPCVLGEPLRGGQLSTYERYSPLLRRNLEHITRSWTLIVRLKGFLFFGSAQSMIASVRREIEAQRDMPRFKRLRYLVFDCKLLDGMDASASKAMGRLRAEAEAAHIQVIWAGAAQFFHDLQTRQVLPPHALHFDELSDVLLYVDSQAIRYLSEIQERWVALHPVLALRRQLHRVQAASDPFASILTMDTMRHGCVWQFCKQMPLAKGKTMLWEPGQVGVDLFLVHSGAVGLFRALPESGRDWEAPVAVYRAGWFLNCEMLTQSCTQHYAVVLEDGEAVHWTQRQWFKMQTDRPHMSAAITKAIFKQQTLDWHLSLSRESPAVGPSPKAGGEVEERLQSAQVLESYGLFASPVGDAHPTVRSKLAPEMPEHFVSDLQVAFATFSSEPEETVPKEWVSTHYVDAVIPSSKVQEALLFAGISNVVIGDGLSPYLSLPEFLLVGQHAIMASLSEEQVAGVKDIFQRYDEDSSGELDLAELDTVLTRTIYPSISIEEISGICSFWDDDQSGKIGFEEFCKLVSRFVRQREQDWLVLCALRELAGNEHATSESRLTAKALEESTGLAEPDVAELLWAVNWRKATSSGVGETAGLRLGDALAMLLLDGQQQAARLPPRPPNSLSRRKRATPEKLTALYLAARAESAPELREAIAASVWDFRVPENRHLAATALKDMVDEQGEEHGEAEAFPTGGASEELKEPALESVGSSPKSSASRRLSRFQISVRLHRCLYQPRSSSFAMAWCLLMFVTVLTSLVLLVMEPMVPMSEALWFGFEIYVTVIFSLELLLKLLVVIVQGHGVRNLLTDLGTLVDLLAVLPLYLEVAFSLENHDLLRMNRFLRVTRVFRFIRLQRADSVTGPLVTVLAVIWGIFLYVGLDYLQDEKA